MRTIFIIFTLCFGTTHATEKAFAFNVTYREIKDAKEIIGKWSFSEQWSGYMGLAIEFKEHEFRYWATSDFKSPDEPKYPIVGTWELVKGVVVLKAPEGEQLYSDEWVMTKSGESVGLTNPDNVKVLIWQQASPASRMLTKWHEEPDTWPMLNMPGPWRKSAQQAGADQPATKPADKHPVKGEPSTPTSKDHPR